MHFPGREPFRSRLVTGLSEIGRRGDERPMIEGVYERIKSGLMARIPAPGQLLQIGVLAEELGVSATPVREALTRLATERLILSTRKRGFFTWIPSETDLLGLYCVNETLLDGAIARWPGRHTGRTEASVPCLDDSSPAQMVRHTAELFTRLAARCGLPEFAIMVGNLNDRLHHARLIEQDLIRDTHREWMQLAALDAAGRRDELRAALGAYHKRRQREAGALSRELLLRAFSPARR